MKTPSVVLTALFALMSFGCGSKGSANPTSAKIGGYTFTLGNFTSSVDSANVNNQAMVIAASDGNTCAITESIVSGDATDTLLANRKLMSMIFGVGNDQGNTAAPTATGEYPIVFVDGTGSAPVAGNYARLAFVVYGADGKSDALHPDTQPTTAQAGDATAGTLKVTALPATGSDGPLAATVTATVGPQKDVFQMQFTTAGCHLVPGNTASQ